MSPLFQGSSDVTRAAPGSDHRPTPAMPDGKQLMTKHITSVHRAARYALAGVACLFAAALFAQVFTAGMAVFANPAWWALHRAVLHTFEWLSPLAVLLALLARAPRAVVGLACVTVALLAVQYATAHLRLAPSAREWAALHPVSAVLLVWSAIELARRAVTLVRNRRVESGMTPRAAHPRLGSAAADMPVVRADGRPA